MMGEEPGTLVGDPSPSAEALLTHGKDLDALVLQLCCWPLSIILGLAIRDEDADLQGQAQAIRPSSGHTASPLWVSPRPPP